MIKMIRMIQMIRMLRQGRGHGQEGPGAGEWREGGGESHKTYAPTSLRPPEVYKSILNIFT